MNDILENRLGMYQSVLGHYNLHSAILNTIPVVTLLQTELSGIVTSILNIAGPANSDITGYAVDKQNLRNELTNIILKVSIAYSSWCYVSLNNRKAEFFDESRAMLNYKRDNDVYTYAMDLNTTALLDVAALAPFGVLPADFTALTAKAAQYLAIIKDPKIQKGERAAKLLQMSREFDKASDLIKNRLDHVMKAFMLSHLVIYDSYLFARSIEDTGAITPPDYSGTLLPGIVTMVTNIPYLSSRSFKVKNKGEDFLNACLSNNDTILQGVIMVVEGGNNKQWLSSTFNPDFTANYLLLQNNSPLPLDYEITIEE